MAIDIFDQGFSDHVVFDRIVDCDRTITLARQAADKAEENGQLEKAAALRAKADYLEEILQNTQNPDYSDEDPEGEPPESPGDSGNQTDAQNNNDKSGPESSAEEEEEANASGSNNSAEENQNPPEDSGSGAQEDELKKPDDIADLDSHNGKHGDGTNKTGGGGPSGNSEGSASSGDNNGSGKGKGKGSNKEFDPFKTSLGQGSQGQQITPEQELEAIIKRLAGLTGEAKKGADRGLQDFFNQITGGGSL
jgi:hypothetical protein